ncbi:MAG TPA: glycosyltransferase family 4 protein [Kiritimatiellia bacterium]|nr:glycosyltransferase family 4 protein [Kiritimatiellia bacterium]
MTVASKAVPPRVAVLFSRLGPYHLARLRGAASALDRAGAQLAAIAVAGIDRVYAWQPVALPTAYLSVVLFPDIEYEQIGRRKLIRRLRAQLDAFDPVAVALPGWSFIEAKAGLEWCRDNGRAAILMTESAQSDHFRLWPREIAKQVLVRKFHAALVGGGSHADYARALGIPRACIFHGYDAVDNDYFIQGAERVRADAAARRAAAGLPPRYLLTSSRFVEKKNIDGLLRGYALFAARRPDAPPLVVCGDGPLRDALKQLAVTLGVQDRVVWPGFVQYPDLPTFYALADGFILASTTEQWGLVVNEAAASGLPLLVSSRCGCAADLVREGENGYTFNPRAPEAIAGALARLPAEPEALARMGRRSRELVAAVSPEVFGANLLEAARVALARIGREDLTPAGDAG